MHLGNLMLLWLVFLYNLFIYFLFFIYFIYRSILQWFRFWLEEGPHRAQHRGMTPLFHFILFYLMLPLCTTLSYSKYFYFVWQGAGSYRISA